MRKEEAPIQAISVKVTQNIIDAAIKCNKNKCMVADAVHKKYPLATHIWVDTSRITFTVDGLRYYFIPPTSVKNFIMKYDKGESVKPFSFRTDFLARVKEAGDNTYPEGKPNRGKATDKKKRKKRNPMPKMTRINGVCVNM